MNTQCFEKKLKITYDLFIIGNCTLKCRMLSYDTAGCCSISTKRKNNNINDCYSMKSMTISYSCCHCIGISLALIIQISLNTWNSKQHLKFNNG